MFSCKPKGFELNEILLQDKLQGFRCKRARVVSVACLLVAYLLAIVLCVVWGAWRACDFAVSVSQLRQFFMCCFACLHCVFGNLAKCAGS